MTKANSILHRAVALLAALCLLASMALPVYAAETETDFSASNSETIQKDADTTSEGSKTEPEISVPNSETITNSADTTDKAAGAPLAESVTGSENTAPADSAAADKTAPDEEKPILPKKIPRMTKKVLRITEKTLRAKLARKKLSSQRIPTARTKRRAMTGLHQ